MNISNSVIANSSVTIGAKSLEDSALRLLTATPTSDMSVIEKIAAIPSITNVIVIRGLLMVPVLVTGVVGMVQSVKDYKEIEKRTFMIVMLALSVIYFVLAAILTIHNPPPAINGKFDYASPLSVLIINAIPHIVNRQKKYRAVIRPTLININIS